MEGVLEAQRRQGTWPSLHRRSTAEPGLKPRAPNASLGELAGQERGSLRKEVIFQESAEHSGGFLALDFPGCILYQLWELGKLFNFSVSIASLLNRDANELAFRNPLVGAGHVVSTQYMLTPVIVIWVWEP